VLYLERDLSIVVREQRVKVLDADLNNGFARGILLDLFLYFGEMAVSNETMTVIVRP
jgi:hypothetical protein